VFTYRVLLPLQLLRPLTNIILWVVDHVLVRRGPCSGS
jgi:hypothetical protein